MEVERERERERERDGDGEGGEKADRYDEKEVSANWEKKVGGKWDM